MHEFRKSKHRSLQTSDMTHRHSTLHITNHAIPHRHIKKITNLNGSQPGQALFGWCLGHVCWSCLGAGSVFAGVGGQAGTVWH